MINLFAAATFLLLSPGIASAEETGQLKAVTKADHKVVCKDLKSKNCKAQDYTYLEINEKDVDALEARIEEAESAREAKLHRKLTEAERRAVTEQVLKAEFNRRAAQMEKQSGRKLDKNERRVMYKEFRETALDDEGESDN